MSTTSWQGITALSTILPVLCIVVVVLRFDARLKQKSSLKFDDWAQIPSLLTFLGMCITCLIGVANKAVGYPDPPGAPYVIAPSIILNSKLSRAVLVLQAIALSITKCSALAFYRRIFCSVRPSLLNTIIWILMIVTAAWGLGFIGAYFAACGSKPDAAWEGDLPWLEYCSNIIPKLDRAFAISDFILENLVLLVPIPSIWRSRMSTGRKIGVTGVFMLALIGYGACTNRLVRIIILANATFTDAVPDVQLANTEDAWLSLLEAGFAIIAVNLPPLGNTICKIPQSILRSWRSFTSISPSNSDSDRRDQFNRPRSHTPAHHNRSSTSQDIAFASQGGLEPTISSERHVEQKEAISDTEVLDLERGSSRFTEVEQDRVR